MVECHLAKVKVASPNLVSRSTLLADDHSSASVLWHHSQVVRQRSAKPLFPSSSLGGASKDLLQREILFYSHFLPLSRLDQQQIRMSRPLHGRRQLNSFYSPGLINSPMGRGGLPHGRVAFTSSYSLVTIHK